MPEETNLFVIEGVDACGKTTVCKALSKSNQWKYLRTPTGIFRNQNHKIELLGDNNLSFTYFVCAILNTSFLIRKILNNSKSIICDRYYPTLVVYYDAINYKQNYISINKLPIVKPKLIIHLYVNYNLIKERLIRKKMLNFDEIKILNNKSYFTKLIKGYRKECDIEIDATNLSINDIVNKINALLI